MATNKWLGDLQTLQATTDTLKNTLRAGEVTVYDTDTLPIVVNKTASLSPLVEQDEWQPDPLWVFPDPNGSDELKTIRQIYDEDTTTGYTYKSIYLIKGEDDTTNLKDAYGTTSITFKLSDGTTYTNVTASSLVHTWDKNKDVIDSLGNRVRYIIAYNNGNANCSNFGHTVIWAILRPFTSINVTSGNSSRSYYNYIYDNTIKCIEIEAGVNGLSYTGSNYYFITGSTIEKIVYYGTNANIFGYSFQKDNPKLKTLNAPNILSGNFYLWGLYSLKKFIAPSSFYGNMYVSQAYTLDTLDMANSKIQTLSLEQTYALRSLSLPNTLTGLSMTSCGTIHDFVVPNNVLNFSMPAGSVNLPLHTLTISGIDTIVNIASNVRLYDLRTIVVPNGFKNVTSLYLANSLYLEHDSIVNMFENLADLTGQSAKIIYLGSTNLAKLTDEEKEIATNKNWTLS